MEIQINSKTSNLFVYIVALLFLAANVSFWLSVRDVRSEWANVPPVPSALSSKFLGAGDAQLAYRTYGIMLQNLGDTGGVTTALADYDYPRLGEWFLLMDRLDWRSDFVPLLAAYYFGGTPKTETLRPVVEYLSVAGNHTYKEKWRWLAQAVYLARFKLKDQELALKYAHMLADLYDRHTTMPIWTKSMPAFVLSNQGDKEAALQLMLGILEEEAENVHPSEVNFMLGYICERLLEPHEADQFELCSSL